MIKVAPTVLVVTCEIHAGHALDDAAPGTPGQRNQ